MSQKRHGTVVLATVIVYNKSHVSNKIHKRNHNVSQTKQQTKQQTANFRSGVKIPSVTKASLIMLNKPMARQSNRYFVSPWNYYSSVTQSYSATINSDASTAQQERSRRHNLTALWRTIFPIIKFTVTTKIPK